MADADALFHKRVADMRTRIELSTLEGA